MPKPTRMEHNKMQVSSEFKRHVFFIVLPFIYLFDGLVNQSPDIIIQSLVDLKLNITLPFENYLNRLQIIMIITNG